MKLQHRTPPGLPIINLDQTALLSAFYFLRLRTLLLEPASNAFFLPLAPFDPRVPRPAAALCLALSPHHPLPLPLPFFAIIPPYFQYRPTS